MKREGGLENKEKNGKGLQSILCQSDVNVILLGMSRRKAAKK